MPETYTCRLRRKGKSFFDLPNLFDRKSIAHWAFTSIENYVISVFKILVVVVVGNWFGHPWLNYSTFAGFIVVRFIGTLVFFRKHLGLKCLVLPWLIALIFPELRFRSLVTMCSVMMIWACVSRDKYLTIFLAAILHICIFGWDVIGSVLLCLSCWMDKFFP